MTVLGQRFKPVTAVNIGYLVSSQAQYRGFPEIQTTAGILKMATNHIRQRYNKSIKVLWKDSQCEEVSSLIHGYDLVTNLNVSAIIGPACEQGIGYIMYESGSAKSSLNTLPKDKILVV